MNRKRSPTAERLFAARHGIETASAGVANDADVPVTPEVIEWADVIFVMERAHRTKLASKFQRWLKGKRIVCLNIPDEFSFMDPRLIELLQERAGGHLQ